ncbi:hypothetical protein ACFV4K_29235 [Nocardia sp. NPDC059764]|uniref:hypothetical protein n=1 Tax=Nocardia sp. NPDC059764 TaxID=3346939 RepID=UPI0036684D5E
MVGEAVGGRDRTGVDGGSDGTPEPLDPVQLSDPYGEYRSQCAALLDLAAWQPPVLEPDTASHPPIPFEALVDAGALEVHEAPPTVGSTGGDTPMLTAKDVRLGRAPSRWGSADAPGAITVRAGDVAVAISTEPAVRVCTADGALLGPGIRLVRANSGIDPHFLAGILRAALEVADGSHIDIYEVAVPRIDPSEQRRYGMAFERLTTLETAFQQQRANIAQLVRIGFGGMARGTLRPVADGQ